MRSSSPSKAHSSQVPIKVQHQIAKKKIRRRRVDLPCGCSYFVAIGCHNNGFTHRGTTHCNSIREWRMYLDGQQSPIFQDNRAPRQTIQEEQRHNGVTKPVHPEPEESVGDTQLFSSLPTLDSFTSTDIAFLKNL
uniref:Transcriptional activator protein n=1 Tax=Squash leaf curl Yunnan virus TaxID=222474 RepID=A0A7D5BTM0_9GEMI|nr:transcriptional activator protein [Squash leaf curl Yunnan virus]